MLPAAYISTQPTEWQEILKAIHAMILAEDKTVTAVVEPMMGKEMILYKSEKGKGMMKYGLSGVKKYMSLHVLPMYVFPKIYGKYQPMLAGAKFQKGCINFVGAADMPLPLVKQLIADCAAIDMQQIRNDHLQSKAAAKKKLAKG